MLRQLVELRLGHYSSANCRNKWFFFLGAAVISAVLILTLNKYQLISSSSSILRLGIATTSKSLPPPPPSDSLCSFKLLKAYLRSRPDGYISGEGKWTQQANGQPDRFFPDICRFQYGRHFPQEPLLKCLHRKNIKYIALMGDSNGMRMIGQIINLINDGSPEEMARVKMLPGRGDDSPDHISGKSYYMANGIPEQVIYTHERDCRGCRNGQVPMAYNLGSGINGTLLVESLISEFTIDSELSSYYHWADCIQSEFHEGLRQTPCPTSQTTQQFLLKEYFGKMKPDLLIVLGNAHDDWRFSLKEHAMNVRYFADMLDIYLPPTTKVIWTSKPGEYARFTERKPTNYTSHPIPESTNQKLTLLEWLDAANRIMYDNMKSRFLASDRPLMFLDLLAMSVPVLPSWNIDGVHMHGEWYQIAASYMLQTLCNS